MYSIGIDPVAKPGYFLGLLSSVENPLFPDNNVESWTLPEDRDIVIAEVTESSDQNEVLSLPNMRVSLDDFDDHENEAQSEPPMIRSIHEETGECSEQYEQHDENIFSSFNPIDSSEVSSKIPCPIQGERSNPMEQAMRDYCHDNSIEMFKPRIGMTFDSLTEAFLFYNSYSWVQGFSIRKGDSYTNTKKIRTMQELTCQRWGRNKNTKLSTTLCGCKASLKACLNDEGKWYVKTFSEEHNHELVESCGEKKHLYSHNHIDQHTKDIIRYLRENNVSLSRVDSIMGSYFGSAEKVPFTKKTLRTVCSRIAKESLQDDITKTMESFWDMIAKDEKFVFSAQLDDENTLKSLMWTSGRSRALYEHFGDAITFDTTYETNIYKMPFGMFVGVSNHFESVIFAGVLLSNETNRDFRWAFKEFVSMKGGKPPVTMLTDQARAMMIAIKDVLPHTNHRWCKWHVLRKAHEVLGHVYKKHVTFSDDFHKLVNHMLTIEEFEKGWHTITEKYSLQENPFMIRAFECREKWAKPYFQGIFCAKMASTQRSESANHVLKIYIPNNSSINKFVAQYSKLITDRESCDHACEKNTKQKTIHLQVGYPVEKHASVIYTKRVYELFKLELLKSTKYVIVPRTESNVFEVKHVQAELRDSWCKVNYIIEVDNSIGFYKCQCGLYEHFGILCSHILTVFIHRGVCSIPDCHIMKRWTRQARMTNFDPNIRKLGKDRRIESRSFRHKILYMAAMEMVNQAEVDERSCEIALQNIERGKKEMSEFRLSKRTNIQVGYRDCSGTSGPAVAGMTDLTEECKEAEHAGLEIFDRANNIGIPVSSIQAPKIKMKTGRQTNKRYMSRLDGNIQKKKRAGSAKRTNVPGGLSGVVQSRFCKKCQSPAHNITSCPKRLEEEAAGMV